MNWKFRCLICIIWSLFFLIHFDFTCNVLFPRTLKDRAFGRTKKGWINCLRHFMPLSAINELPQFYLYEHAENENKSRKIEVISISLWTEMDVSGNSKLFRFTLWANKMPVEQCWVIPQTVLQRIQSKEIGNKKYHEESKDTFKMAKWDIVWISTLDSVGREGRLMHGWMVWMR